MSDPAAPASAHVLPGFGHSADPGIRARNWLILLAALLAIYIPSVGHGFIRDDFAWIRSSEIREPLDMARLFAKNVGFYRPVVSVSFAINRMAGLEPIAYDSVNLALLIACAALAASLFTRIGLSASASLFGAGLWALNVHGINMAVLWISGRTALLLVMWSLLAARAALADAWVWAGFWTLLALLSKEEAVLLPVILLAWRWLMPSPRAQRPPWTAATLAVFGPLAAYFVLRIRSGAMTPFNAPPEYRFVTDAAALAKNIVEYADRAGTLAGLVTVVAVAVAMAVRPSAWTSTAAQLTGRELSGGPLRRIVGMGLVWLIGGYAITVLVPVRSSLYACFPSIGAALIAAAVCERAYRAMTPRRRTIAVAGALVLPFLLWPVYRTRNTTYDKTGALSNAVLAELRALPPASRVVITDTRERPNMAGAFGSLLPDALVLRQIPVDVCVEQPAFDCAKFAADGEPPIRFTVRGNRLTREGSRQ